jgi:hypothetical protein
MEDRMGDEIGVGSLSATTHPVRRRKLVPMQVGNATVYISSTEDILEVEATDQIYAVALNPKEAFDKALDMVKEIARVIGERVEQWKKL